jgi:hypothetical protein
MGGSDPYVGTNVEEKTLRLLRAMREQIGERSASRDVSPVVAANCLGMDVGEPAELAACMDELLRADYLEPHPDAVLSARGRYRITFRGIAAAEEG